MSYQVREVQSTPNPNAVKLVLDRVISPVAQSFRSGSDTGGNEVAGLLLALKGVVAVLLLNDFVTINKSPEARWTDITRRAKRILGDTR
jgi:hypothetical protein